MIKWLKHKELSVRYFGVSKTPKIHNIIMLDRQFVLVLEIFAVTFSYIKS